MKILHSFLAVFIIALSTISCSEQEASLEYCKELFNTQSWEEAFRICNEIAEQGDSEALSKVAFLWFTGRGSNMVDETKGLSLLQQSAALGNLNAQTNLGLIYLHGKWNQEQHYGQALQWFNAAADRNHAPAKAHLAYMYSNGLGVKQDILKAYQFNKEAAELGNALAQLNLGSMYYFGNGVEKDINKALLWTQKAADQEEPQAEFRIGYEYQVGGHFSQDLELAKTWYEKSSRQGYALAQAYLSQLYFAEKNYAQAIKWANRAAIQGEPLGQYILGHLYHTGKGLFMNKVNYAQAYKWYVLALERVINKDKTLEKTVLKSLNALEKQLSKADKKQAKHFIENWKPAPEYTYSDTDE